MEQNSSPLQSRSVQLAVFIGAPDAAAIEDQLTRLQRKADVLIPGGIAEAASWCACNTSPQVLVVDIAGQAHPLASLVELAAQCGPTCRIVAVGVQDDVILYRQLLSAGIFDYLLKPLRLDLLADTLARADDDRPLGQGGVARSGRTVAVIGTSGGLGASTLVAALGQWLAQVQHAPCVLVDFDRRQADLALLLGLEADTGLAHLLDSPSIDPRLLQRTLLSAGEPSSPSRLQLLAQRPGPETHADANRVLELGAGLCQLFSLSLWDLPSHRPVGSDEVLAHAEVRIVLTPLSVQGARNTQRLLADIGDESDGQQLLLVASGVAHGGQSVLETRQFESFVGRSIDIHLPYTGTALASSLLQGALKAQVAPDYAHAVAAMGRRLLNLPASPGVRASSSLVQRIAQQLRLRSASPRATT
ncbi:hypothetical protein F3J24_21515 [Comamonas sp. Tr-654]|uniref:AAA family ATPase n=1 Tax=Comamonas sp. Tr-654 TaxID=2608341 RepID=UPI0014248361|nr:hypothetical protein [Comamonas sp. Tr-654]NIF86060.1 hypothetical protein [Comamonas sp. Tr-654]